MIRYQSAFHSIEDLCRVLNVSRSGYYDWLNREPSERDKSNQSLSGKIIKLFECSRQTYGVPRIQNALKNQGNHHGKARISKIMKANNLKPKAAKRFKVTTDSQHARLIAPNVLARNFNPPAPNKAWAADITYIPTGEGWLYLATVIDLHSRMVIGWSMNKHMKTELIHDALNMAIWKRKPPKGVVHHSDRGSQYCSEIYRALQAQHGFVCSMSAAGNCYDNAVMESFYHSLKVELIHGQKYETREEASKAIFDYVEVFYNSQRLHSSLGYQTPEMFDRAA